MTPPLPSRRQWRQATRRGLLALALVTLAALAHFSTAAIADELPDQARDALQKGNEAVQQRQWVVAGQQFKIATDLAGSAPEVLLGNARFAEQKGGRDVIAIAWYRAYMATQTDAKERANVKARIAALEQRIGSTSKGLIDKALNASSNLPANERSGMLTSIAIAQTKIGDLNGALATASSARAAAGTNSWGDDPYGRVADTLAGMGDLATADDVMRRVEQGKRSNALRQIAWTLTYAKRFSDALNYAARTSGADQITAYSAIAKAQADAGDKDGARASLNSAINAVNYLDQNSRRGTLLNLVATAAASGEFDTARRLYADASRFFKANDPNDSFYLNTARWEWANGLVRWDRLTEAEAMLPTVFANNTNPSFAWYRPNLIGNIQAARQRQAQALKEKFLALVRSGKIAEADAALTREPPTQAAAAARLALAEAYIAKSDMAAAHRHIEPAAAALTKTTVANFGSAYEFTNTRIELADDYRAIGDLAASKRVLDATAGTIAKLAKPNERQAPISYLCTAYARLAAATAATKNFAGAKSIALEAVKLVAQSSAADRTSCLVNLAGLGIQVGMTNDLAAAVPSLASGYGKQNILTALVNDYVALGQDANALAMAGRIEDQAARKTALSNAIAKRTVEKNWTAALALANEPVVSGRLYPEIAAKMLAAGMVQEAAALEPKFTAGSDEANGYFASLAQYLGNHGNTDAALAAAMRISAIERRVSTLFSMTYGVNYTAGRVAARTVYDRAIAQFAELKSAADRSRACNQIDYYLRYGYFVDDDGPAKSDGSAPSLACVAEALAQPLQQDRLSSLGLAMNYNVTIGRPLIGSTAPTRPAISRLLAEASGQSDVSSRDNNLQNGLNALARDGAIEAAMALGAASLTSVSRNNASNVAVTWLVDAGDTATAQRILNEQVDAIAGIVDAAEKNAAYARTSALALVLGDYDRATKLAAEIKSAGDRVSAFAGIAGNANSHERFDVALNALDRAVAADKEADSHYYRSSFYAYAAQAGHKNAEAFLDDYLADKSVTPTTRVSARSNTIYWLLKWKQNERAAALIPALEAELAQLGPAERWPNAASFALSLATLGDTARLNKLFADAPQPENKTQILLSAAAGFIKAEKPEAARAAADRALELSAGITDTVIRWNTLQSIALYQVQTGAADAARKILTQSIDVLKIRRPDLPGWVDFTVAVDQDGTDPAQAAKLALAISDPFWRTSAIVRLANNRFAAAKTSDALTLLRAAPPSALADGALESISRSLLAKHDFDTARELIGRVSHAGIRDQLKRRLLLAQARSGATEAALADIATLENKVVRAYTFIDLGAFLLTQKGDGQAQSGYFAQLGDFAATRLAEQIPDALIKADILADAGHGLNDWQSGAGAPYLARAVAVAGEIADARAKQYAVQWANGLDAAHSVQKPDPLMAQDRDAMTYKARSWLTEDWFLDLDAHIESFASSNPTDRINKLTSIAVAFADQLREMRNSTADFEKKRKLAP